MTSPDITVNQDELQAAGGRWNAMSGDLDVGSPPHPGNDPTDPTVLATVAVHGTMHLTTAQLQEMLQSYASGTQKTASKFGEQDKGSAMSMDKIMSMITGGVKDVSGVIQPFVSAIPSAVSSFASAASAGVSAVTSAMKPATSGSGNVAGGLTDPNNINHDATTNERKSDGQHDAAKPVSRS